MSKKYTIPADISATFHDSLFPNYYYDRFLIFNYKDDYKGTFESQLKVNYMAEDEVRKVEHAFKSVMGVEANETVSAKQVSDFLSSFTVIDKNNNSTNEAKNPNYIQFYGIDDITEYNKHVAMAHFIYNIKDGKFARGYLDNKISISRINEGEYEYIVPSDLEAKVEAARENISTANNAPEPHINFMVEFFGNISKKIGFNNWFSRKVDTYKKERDAWLNKTDVQNDIDIVTKYDAMNDKIERRQAKIDNKSNSKEKFRMLLNQTNSSINLMNKLVISDDAVKNLDKSFTKLENLSQKTEDIAELKDALDKAKNDYKKAKEKQAALRTKHDKKVIEFENLEKKVKPENNSKRFGNNNISRTSSMLSNDSAIL